MDNCRSLEEVRRNIDAIDGRIVALLSERGVYVRQAAEFKTTRDDVRAPKRVEAVVTKVRELAVQHGAEPDVVEAVYRAMIPAFIDHELRAHATRAGTEE